MANTYHSIIFDDGTNRYHTWDDWHLIPSSRPVIAHTTPILKYVDIPGKDGSLDITDYLVGRPTYPDRKGTFEFLVINDNVSIRGNTSPVISYGNWETRRTELAAFFNGKKMKIFLEDDPAHYYYGRVFFKEWRPDAQFSRITIEYQVDPYKYSLDGEEAGL